ncbi:TetR family transcriptional regulator [Xylanimonas allomyrinae]|uniref:TetR family transcriptional regulator n=1 Tax=Xylanimonas allomyrinae TaxID=2509459 RepID=A0A4P6EK27_9MICO|nr:TetR/AcrR family transcriptional regulator [Xylanimonas allomyrinae]QAY62962.1 TetR family transcriptional regulator [Xylanimonas allomyrinae]
MADDTPDARSTSRDLKDAVAALTKALGQTLSEAGSAARREVADELAAASRELSRELGDAASELAGRSTARATKAERTRADLVAAARTVFAAQGYEGASVADIASAAGYTKGALYANFASKEDLFVEVARQFAGRGTGPDDATPSSADLDDILLSLEVYLFALRHPRAQPELRALVAQAHEALATEVHRQRTGRDGEPARADYDVALGLAALHNYGAILRPLLAVDVDGAVERLGASSGVPRAEGRRARSRARPRRRCQTGAGPAYRRAHLREVGLCPALKSAACVSPWPEAMARSRST